MGVLFSRAAGLLAFAGPSLLLSPALAAALAADVPEVTVTVTRLPTRLDQVGSSVSVITAEEIDLSQRILFSDLLDRVPGVSVSRSGGLGGVTTSFVRGAASERTLVLIDGVKVNDQSSPGAGFNFANMLSDDIARAEILRGPQSTLYGTDAIGGVMNIVTASATKPLELSGMAEGGSFGTARGNAAIGSGGDAYNIRGSVSYIDTKGISSADKANGNPEPDGYDNVTLYGKGEVTVAQPVRVGGTVRYADADAQFDSFAFSGPFPIVDGDESAKTKEFQGSGWADLTLFDGKFDNLMRISRSTLDRDSYQNGAISFTSRSRSTHFEYQGTARPTEMIALLFGGDLENNSMRAEGFGSVTTGSADIKGAFGEAQVTLLDRLTLTGGVRHDHHERVGGVTTFRSTANLDVTESGTILRASWGEGFKAPTLYQLFDAFSGNPGLLPERSRGWDAGVEQRLADNRVILQATYFHRVSNNEIDFDFSTFTYGNILATRSQGLELTATLNPMTDITVNASYSLVDAVNRATDLRLVQRPKHAAHGDIAWRATPEFTLSMEVNYTGARPDSSGVTLGSYVVADLRAAYDLSAHVQVFGRIDNLFDEQYEQVFGYGTPGIAGYAGVRVKL
jgi:vitamin B12 transporter